VGIGCQIDDRRYYWAICLTLALTPFLAARTEIENLAVLIIPLAMVLSIIRDRWFRFGNKLVILILTCVLILPWAGELFEFDLYGLSPDQSISFFSPAGHDRPVLDSLVVFRAPRTWLDRSLGPGPLFGRGNNVHPNFIILFLLGLIPPVLIAQFQPVPGYLDSDYYFAGGIQLAAGRGFNDPISGITWMAHSLFPTHRMLTGCPSPPWLPRLAC